MLAVESEPCQAFVRTCRIMKQVKTHALACQLRGQCQGCDVCSPSLGFILLLDYKNEKDEKRREKRRDGRGEEREDEERGEEEKGEEREERGGERRRGREREERKERGGECFSYSYT